MAWRRPGDKPLSEPMMVNLPTHICVTRPQWVKMGNHNAWWRHQMETYSALLALCEGIRRSAVNSPHKGQWRGALMFYLICAWTKGWVNNQATVDLRRHRSHYDVTVMDRPNKQVNTTSATNILTKVVTLKISTALLYRRYIHDAISRI